MMFPVRRCPFPKVRVRTYYNLNTGLQSFFFTKFSETNDVYLFNGASGCAVEWPPALASDMSLVRPTHARGWIMREEFKKQRHPSLSLPVRKQTETANDFRKYQSLRRPNTANFKICWLLPRSLRFAFINTFCWCSFCTLSVRLTSPLSPRAM